MNRIDVPPLFAMPPIDLIGFVADRLDIQKADYVDWERYSRSGDRGPDVVGFKTDRGYEGPRHTVVDLDTLGLFSGRIRLTRNDRVNSGEEAIDIRCALMGIGMAEADLREIAEGGQDAFLSAPLERLVRRLAKLNLWHGVGR